MRSERLSRHVRGARGGRRDDVAANVAAEARAESRCAISLLRLISNAPGALITKIQNPLFHLDVSKCIEIIEIIELIGIYGIYSFIGF